MPGRHLLVHPAVAVVAPQQAGGSDVEVLDFCGPFEVFSVTRVEADRRDEPSPFEVLLVAETTGPVLTTGGMKVIPDHTLDDCPRLDILVVPGGWGTRAERKNARLVGWIAERATAGNA